MAAGVKHMCAFNHRFAPAVTLARASIAAGELGTIHQFRGAYPRASAMGTPQPLEFRDA